MGRFGLAGAVKRDGRARGAIKQIHCLYYTHVPQITSQLEHESAQDEDEVETLMIIWLLADVERKVFHAFSEHFGVWAEKSRLFVRQGG